FPPSPPTSPRAGGRRDYLIGLGIGLIPLLIAMAGLGGSFNSTGDASTIFSILVVAGLVLYLIEFILMIVFLVLDRFRMVGFGLLTMVVASPIVFFIGCVALLTRGFGNA